jgi:hypothetical protein
VGLDRAFEIQLQLSRMWDLQVPSSEDHLPPNLSHTSSRPDLQPPLSVLTTSQHPPITTKRDTVNFPKMPL